MESFRSTKKTATFSPSTIIRDNAKRGLLELNNAITEADPSFLGMELFVELHDLIAKHLNSITSLVKEIPSEGERKEMLKGESEASLMTCKVSAKLIAYALRTKQDLREMKELSESAKASEKKLKQLLDVKCNRLADLKRFEQKLKTDRENFDQEVSSAMKVMTTYKADCDKVLEEAKKAAAPCRYLTQAERDVVKLKHLLKTSEEENEELRQELQTLRPKDAQSKDHRTQPDKIKPRRTK